jgi:HAMP domain-containing protein
MKNLPIRVKILTGVVVVNLLGAAIVMTYLHQSYSSSVYVTAARTATLGLAAFEDVVSSQDLDLADPDTVNEVLGRVKAITGHDYGLLLDKSVMDEGAYNTMLTERSLPNNWNERDNNVLIGVTDSDVAGKISFGVAPGDVPASGRMVGVENGACTERCHGNLISVEGDYWYSAWSTDRMSRAHAVFPINDSGGQPAAVIYAIEDVSWQADHAKDAMMNTLLWILGTLGVSTLAIGGMIDAFVFRRLRHMTESMQAISIRVAGGDFDAHYKPSGLRDEIGQFETFFASLMDLMTSTLKSFIGKD